ncbi:MAG TPA: hypothetical protein VJI33_00490 [Candidatus Paceibacterota bacterium]
MAPIPFINIEYIFYQIYKLFTGGVSAGGLYDKLVNLSVNLMPFSIVFTLLAIVGIIYCFMRLREVEHGMIHAIEGGHHGEIYGHDVSAAEVANRRFVRVVDHLNSENESDWRLAILEADLILEEMLHSMGYHGDSISEQLKGIERSDFHSLDQAWEGHKVRNQIAHEGGDFRITNREARRVVSLYEQVFKEFHFI